MRRNEASFFVFVASIIVGLLISFNLSFSGGPKRVFLNAKQYQDAYNKKNNLLKEISNLEEKYNDLNSRVNTYKYGIDDKYRVIDDMKEELQLNQMVEGKVPLEGNGLIITLKDVATLDEPDIIDSSEYTLRLIHDADLMQLLNDLKNGGAEAIAINGQRIIDRSDIYCGGSYISINGVKCPAPYYISVIGNEEVINNYLNLPQNYISFLKLRHIEVYIEQKNSIKIPAYNGDIKIEYINKK